jgi:hypothetical protein
VLKSVSYTVGISLHYFSSRIEVFSCMKICNTHKLRVDSESSNSYLYLKFVDLSLPCLMMYFEKDTMTQNLLRVQNHIGF